jgi:hypothetical protein
MATRRCGYCEWYRKKKEHHRYGKCQVNPPQCDFWGNNWPMVTPDDWCSYFKPKEGDDGDAAKGEG